MDLDTQVPSVSLRDRDCVAVCIGGVENLV